MNTSRSYKRSKLALYKELREQGYPARVALVWAREKARRSRFSYELDEVKEYPCGLRLEVMREYDNFVAVNDYDEAFRFVFSHVYNPDEKRFLPLDRWDYFDFEKCLKVATEECWDTPPFTGNRHERARRAVKAVYERVRRYYQELWWLEDLSVKVFLGDELLAEDYLGAVDSDDSPTTLREMAAGCLMSARKELKNSLRLEAIKNRRVYAQRKRKWKEARGCLV